MTVLIDKETGKHIKITQKTKIALLEDRVKRLEAFIYSTHKEEWRQHIAEDGRR